MTVKVGRLTICDVTPETLDVLIQRYAWADAPRTIAADLASDSAHIPIIENIVKKHLDKIDEKPGT